MLARAGLKSLLVCLFFVLGCSSYKGSFKGNFPVYFTGVALDAKTGQDLHSFTLDIAYFDKPFSSKRVQTEGPEYGLSFDVPVFTGRTITREGRELNVLGGPEQNITLTASAPGFKTRRYIIPRDQVALDQVNVLDIVLFPADRPGQKTLADPNVR